MKSRFDTSTRELILREAAGLAAGGTTRINHEDCPSGMDTRRRLYIKVTGDGSMALAHCFNCAHSGGYKLRTFAVPAKEEVPTHLTKEFADAKERFRRHCILYNSGVPMEQPEGHPLSWEKNVTGSPAFCTFPWQYFRLQSEYEGLLANNFFGWKFSSNGILMIPHESSDSMLGFDMRVLSTQADLEAAQRAGVKKPVKWIKSTNPEAPKSVFQGWLIYNPSGSKTGVLCEDPISAAKLALANVAGISMGGFGVPIMEQAHALSLMFDRIVVWFDNDKPEVLEAAELTQDKLSLFLDNVYVERIFKDPKLYPLEDVESILTEYQNVKED